MTPIEKYARQLRIADSFGETLIEKRRAFAAPHRGIRLASVETVNKHIGSIRYLGGMAFLQSIHAEIDANRPAFAKPDEDDKWDNSPYKPEAKVKAGLMDGNED